MKFLPGLFILVAALQATAQPKTRKLSTIINHPSINVYSPSISADGNALVFLSDNSEGLVLSPFYSWRDDQSDWREPQPLPRFASDRLNFVRDYSLSANGKKLYFSSMRSPGVGGFDIWECERRGSGWSEPKNLALPINTKGHEAGASFTPDGNTIYFMRCEKMNQEKAEGCKIFTARKKPNGQWETPVELPAVINAGNAQTPRIMADAETLIFSSDKLPGNKGGMDLYMSRLTNGTWSAPVPLDFVNTAEDDQYVSVTALGRYILKDAPGPRRRELVEFLIPENLRPKGMMQLEGKVTDPNGRPVAAYIALNDLVQNKRVYSGRPAADGSFMIYVKEGSRYELSIDPEQSNVSYYARQFDLTENVPQVEKISATLKEFAPGDEISLAGIVFEPYSSRLDVEASRSELKRLVRAVTGNPHLRFEILVLLDGYHEDSVQSDPDLTEVLYDSIYAQIEKIDTLGQSHFRDSLIVKTIYHNDRTASQANAIINYLVSQGADAGNLGYMGNAIPAITPGDSRKLTVRAVIRKR